MVSVGSLMYAAVVFPMLLCDTTANALHGKQDNFHDGRVWQKLEAAGILSAVIGHAGLPAL